MVKPANSKAEVSESTGPRVIAEWVGSEKHKRVDGSTARMITKKDMQDTVLMEITEDLAWGPATHYRQDITDESEEFQEWLAKDKSFKIHKTGE
jgi:hypothetical protein